MRIKAMMPKFPTSHSHYQKTHIAANIFNDFNRRLQNCTTKTQAEKLLEKTKRDNKKYLKISFTFEGETNTKTLDKRLEDACKQRTMTIKSDKFRKTRKEEKISSGDTQIRRDQRAKNKEKNTEERKLDRELDKARGKEKEYYTEPKQNILEKWISMASAYLQMAERPTIYVRQTKSLHQALREDARSMKDSATQRVKGWEEFAQKRLFSQTGKNLDAKKALRKLRREAGG